MKKIILILTLVLIIPIFSCNKQEDEIALTEEQELQLEYKNKHMQYLIDNFNDVPDVFVLFGKIGFGGGMALFFRKEINKAETANRILSFYYDINEMIRDVQIFTTNLRDFEEEEEILKSVNVEGVGIEIISYEEWLLRRKNTLNK